MALAEFIKFKHGLWYRLALRIAEIAARPCNARGGWPIKQYIYIYRERERHYYYYYYYYYHFITPVV